MVTGNELVGIDSPISDNVSLTTTPDIVTAVVVIAIMEDVTRAGEDDKLPKEEPTLLTELVASNGCGLVLKLGFWLVEKEKVEESPAGTDVLGQHSTTGRKKLYAFIKLKLWVIDSTRTLFKFGIWSSNMATPQTASKYYS